MKRKIVGKNIIHSFIEKKNTGNKAKKRSRYRTSQEIVEYNILNTYEIISAPINFSLLNNPDETINFINELENAYLTEQKTFVDLQQVEHFDHSSVTVLLSVMFSFKKRKIPFNGNFPKNNFLTKMLVESQFFKYLRKKISYTNDYIIGKDDQIFIGNQEVNSELGMPVMMEASLTIWGKYRTCTGLQRTLIELMQNTNNHASGNRNKGEKHWWLSVNHDKKNKKVSFSFVDYGVGIFESLKNKPPENKWFGWAEKITDLLRYGNDNSEIFKLLLEGELHRTVTGHHFRGKGLPGIKQVFDRNQISNLHIISNDVIADVGNNNYLRLKSEFSGTFVSWELNEKNINLEWIL